MEIDSDDEETEGGGPATLVTVEPRKDRVVIEIHKRMEHAYSGSRVIDWRKDVNNQKQMTRGFGILCHVGKLTKEARVAYEPTPQQRAAHDILTETIPELMGERITHNQGLTYMKFRLMPIVASDNLIGYDE